MIKNSFSPDKKLITEIKRELFENKQFDNEIPGLLESLGKYSDLNSDKKKQLLEKCLFLLTTIRNRLLIRKEEQEELKKKVICFLGLSVGSHAVSSWIMESRAKCIKISDPDLISPSNLNRLNATLIDVGVAKTVVVGNRVSAVSPYSKIIAYNTSEINKLDSIILGEPRADLIVEQIDDLEGKIKARKIAKTAKIPLIMATDVGDNVFLDIERYDLDAETEYFNGRVKGLERLNIKKLSPSERIQIAVRLVGLEHNSERMLESLLSIGKTIKTWPQLGTTATISGAIIAKTVRKIFLGEDVQSGRYYFDIEEVLVSDYNEKRRVKFRENLMDKL